MGSLSILQAVGYGTISNIVNGAIVAGAFCACGVIIYGGFMYTISGGLPSRREDAKDWIWAAIQGLLILFGSFLILNTINPLIIKSL